MLAQHKLHGKNDLFSEMHAGNKPIIGKPRLYVLGGGKIAFRVVQFGLRTLSGENLPAAGSPLITSKHCAF